MLEEVDGILKKDEQDVIELSSSSQSSTAPSSDDESSDSSSEDSLTKKPAPPISFGLSAFCEKMKEQELREGKLAEEAAAKAAADKLIAEKLKRIAYSPTTIEENPHFKNVKCGRIISQCLKAMEECISRFPAHHKAYYRISYIYSTFCKSHLKISKEWLLGTGLDRKKISGLFGDRKQSNFFNVSFNMFLELSRLFKNKFNGFNHLFHLYFLGGLAKSC
jgi:hypothetical protein